MKIWRYVDLAKFVSMLATGSLYFAAVAEFKDPYEGWLPRSHMKALAGMVQPYLDQIQATRDAVAAYNPSLEPAHLDAILADGRRKLDMRQVLRDANDKFGVNCWHINEDESDAMWQLYGAAGSGIAIESSKARLNGALQGDGIIIDQGVS